MDTTKFSGTVSSMNTPHDTPCTEAERERIITEALFRKGFLHWLAAHLERDECPKLIREEAAKALRFLIS